MPYLDLLYDMRRPAFARVGAAELYSAMLEQCAWADSNGIDAIHFGEHHGTEDNYLPSTVPLAAAVAARTQRVRLRVLLLAPFHHPLRLAEDLAVLDIVSNGRLAPIVIAGYRPAEFEMYGVRMEDRKAAVEEAVDVLKKAWTGEPFDFHGRRVRVTPTPLQRPRPAVLVGGSYPAVARRGAHYADGFRCEAKLFEAFRDECRRIGRPDPGPWPAASPEYVFVSEDPERTWAQIGPHLMHATNAYAQWAMEGHGRGDARFPKITTLDGLKASPAHKVLTPEGCIELARTLGTDGLLRLQPLCGGIDPKLAWESLELFAAKVVPHIEVRTGHEPGVVGDLGR